MNQIIVRSIVGVVFLAACFNRATANPTGGVVASGSAAIHTVPGTVTVDQTSSIAIINWQTFSIGAGELTKFVQPSATSAALNRVLGGGISTINGTLSANGEVYLINGNGVVVGPGGVVTANSFLASTRNITDANFTAGKLSFSGNGTGDVQNLGTITAQGGDVYLIGKTVDNEGTISAANGTAGLASGDSVLLNQSGDEHVFVSPSPTATSAATKTAVHNSGTITAATAELKAANGNLYALAINNEGVVRANQVHSVGGRIFLTADAGQVVNSGTIKAMCSAGGGRIRVNTAGSAWNRGTLDVSGDNGGKVAISAKNVQNDGLISVRGTSGSGGSVTINATGNVLGGITGKIDAYGWVQGGSIVIQGLGATSEAYLSLTLNADSLIGAAGAIVVDAPTVYLTDATLSATGDSTGGRISIGTGDPILLPGATSAQTLVISPGTTILADATSSGPGGTITGIGTNQSIFNGYAEANGHGKKGAPGTINITGVASSTVGLITTAGTPSTLGSSGSGTFTSTGSGGSGSVAAFEFVDPDAAAGNAFGRPTTGVFNLATNTTLITSPGDSFGGAGAGAVYLFDDATGALLGTLRGSSAGDGVGTSVTLFDTTNFVVQSAGWHGGAGALSFGNGTSGFFNGGGVVSAKNSLVGSTSTDAVGSGGLDQLFTGTYLVLSPDWNKGAGAVTFVNPAFGVAGTVGAANSLVGGAAGDAVGGGGIQQLNNGGNYLVLSPDWGGGKGAITNGNDSSGVAGVVTGANSLLGAAAGDHVGTGNSVFDTQLGYYLVITENWGGNAGAVTWNSSSIGTTGKVSAANSLVGLLSGDSIASGGIDVLVDSQNYVVMSPGWNSAVGAVTLGSGSGGTTGVVSKLNSLVGANEGDQVGNGGITQFPGSGQFAISSPSWNFGAGAVTFANATFGVTGFVGSRNSLVGAASGDFIGSGGFTTLNSGNVLVYSPDFNGNAGAVTWVGINSGIAGIVSSANSLVGAVAGDQIGSGGIMQPSNSDNYVVLSPLWGGTRGAISNGNGDSGSVGIVGAANSLVGAKKGDAVGTPGTITDDFTGYYLVTTANFGGGAGAVTWNDNNSGTTGVISSANSLVGSSAGDHVGNGGITILFNGDYVVTSSDWNKNAGASTWGNAAGGVSGKVSATNSLVGTSAGDAVGSGGIIQLSNSQNYLVLSPSWHGGRGAVTNINSNSGLSVSLSSANSLTGAVAGDDVGAAGTINDPFTGYYLVTTANYRGGAGAVTWNDDGFGTTGVISSTNSLVGSSTSDNVGSGGITILNSGNYLVLSPNWKNGTGAVTFGLEAGGVSGVISAGNSLIGAAAGDEVGIAGVQQLTSGNYLVYSPLFGNSAGAVTWGDGSLGVTGKVSATNSLVGAVAGDQAGSGGITMLASGDYVVLSPGFNNGAGAVTWGDAFAGVRGKISSTNSLVGSHAGDGIGSAGIQELSNGANYLILSPTWNNGAGAITDASETAAIKGLVSASNSLIGANAGDGVGNLGSVIDTQLGYFLVNTTTFAGGAGAVTWSDDATATVGKISSSNSLIGSSPTDAIASGGITLLSNGNYVVLSSAWHNGTGAVTLGLESGGVKGVVGASNSLVGASAGDQVGSGGLQLLANGNFLVLSPDFNASAGAVTFVDAWKGVKGVLASGNSLVGARKGDQIGLGGITLLANGNYLVVSSAFDAGAGAVTFGTQTGGVKGTVSATNSLVGASANDHIGLGGIIQLTSGNYVVLSPLFKGSAGAATWGSQDTGVKGVVSTANSIVGGAPDAGLVYLGESADGTIYLVGFTTDSSHGGGGRVVAGSENGPGTVATPAISLSRS